jgi:hypothetical protein
VEAEKKLVRCRTSSSRHMTYVSHLPLLTRDPRRVRSFFPSVQLITP